LDTTLSEDVGSFIQRDLDVYNSKQMLLLSKYWGLKETPGYFLERSKKSKKLLGLATVLCVFWALEIIQISDKKNVPIEVGDGLEGSIKN
jgi:hypothetical protein